jgi:hypothetical protein
MISICGFFNARPRIYWAAKTYRKKARSRIAAIMYKKMVVEYNMVKV